MDDPSWSSYRPSDLLGAFDITLSQDQRLLKFHLAGQSLIPHRLVGEEAISRPFCYTLDVISQRGDIELKSLIAQPALIEIRQADGGYRPLSGLVDTAALLGEDGGVYYYQLVLVSWLSLLSLGRDSRIFQDKNVTEVIEAVFQGHEIAKGRYRFDLRRDYPARSYCVQYRESDFHFVNRLMEQEGLFFYFSHGGGDHCLVITDSVDTCPAVTPQAIRFHRQAATEAEDALTQWGGRRQQQPTRVSLATFNYKQPRHPATSPRTPSATRATCRTPRSTIIPASTTTRITVAVNDWRSIAWKPWSPAPSASMAPVAPASFR